MCKFLKLVSVMLVIAWLPQLLYSQKTKVLERSTKKAPVWVNAIEKDFIIVSASALTIEEAKALCLVKVKENIVSSIADNISSTSEYYRGEQSRDCINSIFENYESTTRSKSADLGYLKGISLNKAEAFYWEKVSEGGRIRFYYHIKYPFSNIELKKIVLDFEKADYELSMELNEIADNLDNYSTIEEIFEARHTINIIKKAFIDNRRAKADITLSKLENLLKSIAIVPVSEHLGEICYRLEGNGKIFTSAREPKISSNCARVSNVAHRQPEWAINYDYAGCYDNPSNQITIAYPFGASKVFYIDINENKAEIFVQDVIYLLAENAGNEEVYGAKCKMVLVSKYSSPVTIEKISLHWNNASPLVIDNLQIEVKGRGKHEIVTSFPQVISKSKYNSSVQDMISGSILYRSVSGQRFTCNLNYQSVRTMW